MTLVQAPASAEGGAERSGSTSRQAQGASLGSKTNVSTTPALAAQNAVDKAEIQQDQRRNRRSIRYARRQWLWAHSSLKRVRACGRWVVDDVELKLSPNGVAYTTNEAVCGSIHACPNCSSRIRYRRGEDIAAGVGNWISEGNTAFLVTLTASHHWGIPLESLLDALKDAYRSITRGGSYSRERERVRLRGSIRSIEVMFGRNGWHPHYHLLLFLEGRTSDSALKALQERWFRVWQSVLTEHGYRPDAVHGIDWQRVTDPVEAGHYVSKIQEKHWHIGQEMTAGDLKSGRLKDPEGRPVSVTPFDLLDVARAGDDYARALWHEYEQATYRQQVMQWSPGLRALILPDRDEVSDQELAEGEDIGGELIAVVALRDWRRIVESRSELIPELLDLVELSRALLYHRLADLGVDYWLP